MSRLDSLLSLWAAQLLLSLLSEQLPPSEGGQSGGLDPLLGFEIRSAGLEARFYSQSALSRSSG